MKIVKGNKIIELTNSEFIALRAGFERVEVDIGTGDGKFVLKKALEEPKTLFIGVEPIVKQLEDSARKAIRKKLNNLIYVVGSIEQMPRELVDGFIDKIWILMPWGSLLKEVVDPSEKTIQTYKQMLSQQGELEILFGYDESLEPSEVAKWNLPELDNISNLNFLSIYENNGFKQIKREVVHSNQSKVTSWFKRVTKGNRPFYSFIFLKT